MNDNDNEVKPVPTKMYTTEAQASAKQSALDKLVPDPDHLEHAIAKLLADEKDEHDTKTN